MGVHYILALMLRALFVAYIACPHFVSRALAQTERTDQQLADDRCTGKRWPIKTATDVDAKDVTDVLRPKIVTLRDLKSIQRPRPNQLEDDRRYNDKGRTELTVFKVSNLYIVYLDHPSDD